MNHIINALQELEDHGDCYPILIEYQNCLWTVEGDTVIWNTDNNKEDLYNQDGNTYAGEMREDCIGTYNYFITNLDIMTGIWVTMIFNEALRVDYDKLCKECEHG